jgi:Fe-S-cluster containining protein
MKRFKEIIKDAKAKKACCTEASHDPREYDFEGEMTKRDLETIAMHIQRINSLIQDETNMPEWVQGKITLAKDYIQTVSDYLASDVQQEGTEEPTGDLKDACWKGYTAIGTKKKNGKTVPNCVPK